MAYPQAISCNASLQAGMTDGAWKKAAMNRGGVVEETFAESRRDMSGVWHGFNECDHKELPDGRPMTRELYSFAIAPRDTENV